MQNNRIKNNLEKRANKSLNKLKIRKIEDVYVEIIQEMESTVYINTSEEILKSHFESTKIAIERAREHKEFNSLIVKIQSDKVFEKIIVDDFSKQLIEIFNKENFTNELETQLIFFEYDSNPEFYIHGYGKGNYRILFEPKYFNYNYETCTIHLSHQLDFTEVWKNLKELENLVLDEIDFDAFSESEYMNEIRKFYKNKLFYLLSLALDKVSKYYI